MTPSRLFLVIGLFLFGFTHPALAAEEESESSAPLEETEPAKKKKKSPDKSPPTPDTKKKKGETKDSGDGESAEGAQDTEETKDTEDTKESPTPDSENKTKKTETETETETETKSPPTETKDSNDTKESPTPDSENKTKKTEAETKTKSPPTDTKDTKDTKESPTPDSATESPPAESPSPGAPKEDTSAPGANQPVEQKSPETDPPPPQETSGQSVDIPELPQQGASETAGESADSPEDPAPEDLKTPDALTPQKEASETAGETADTPEDPAPKALEAPDAPASPLTKRSFIKGNLAHIGTREMLSRFDHMGINTGVHIIDNNLFLGVDPGLALYWKTFAFALHAPLRLRAVGVTGTEVVFGSFLPRAEDWDDISEFTRFIKFVTIGRKEDRVYFSINSIRPTTIGHGMMMNRYQPNIDEDRFMTGVVFDAYNDYAGFQLQANDITLTNQVLGGLVFVKPLTHVSQNPIARSFSLGLEYFADFRAPLCIEDDQGDCVRGDGNIGGLGPFASGASADLGGSPDDGTLIHPNPNTGLPRIKQGTIHAMGLSTEVKLLRWENAVDLKLYGTHHQFLNERGGSGSALGMLARLNVGEKWLSALRLRGEYRSFEDGFLPGYFDSLYEVSKYGYFPKAHLYQATPTKAQAVFGDPDNGFAQEKHGRRGGYRLEAEWAFFKNSRRNKKFALGLGIEDSSAPDDSNLMVHLDFPALGFIQVFGSLMRMGIKDVSRLDRVDFKNMGDRTIFLSGLRFQLLPFLFLNTHFSYSFRRAAGKNSEYHIATDNLPYHDDNQPRAVIQNFYENVPTLFVELEFGLEFDEDQPPAEKN